MPGSIFHWAHLSCLWPRTNALTEKGTKHLIPFISPTYKFPPGGYPHPSFLPFRSNLVHQNLSRRNSVKEITPGTTSLPIAPPPFKSGFLASGNKHSPKAALISGWKTNHRAGSVPIVSSSLTSSPKAAGPGRSTQHYTGHSFIPGDEGLTAPFTLSLSPPLPAQGSY